MRRAPQDDPLSFAALAGALLAYAGVDLLQARAGAGWAVAAGMTVLDTVAVVVFAWAVLQVAKKSPRFVQTLTALAGTGALLGLVAVPLVQLAVQAQQRDQAVPALAWGWLTLFIWSIAVEAHIFRHALSTRFGVGVVVATLHTLLILVLADVIFPRAAG
jgi:hypothetical protein